MTPKEKARLGVLADKFLKNKISASERAELEAWFREQRDEPLDMPSGFAGDETELEERMFAAIQQRTGHRERRRLTLWPRIAAAASILLTISAGGYFIFHQKQPVQITQNQPHDIAPGHNQATLTLANGQKIVLTKNLKGQLAVQGNTTINVNAGSAIAYTPGTVASVVSYNTLTTNKGEMSPYPLILPDGSKVWLNAASSITFPTAFPGKERIVTLTGEAIFQVAHNAQHPFKINVANQTVEDIGTEFNINAYSDEPNVRVTLASGKAKVIKGANEVTLLPGKEAITTGNKVAVKDADLDAAFAWKNGLFLYDNEPLASMMRQISRWYNVDVVYEGADPNELFGGGISRYKNVSQVLRKLELTGGVHFTIEGRRVIARK